MESPVRPQPREAFLYGAPMQWKSKDGTVWDITEMADEHLENCLKFMERRAVAYLEHTIEQYIYTEGPRGDMAQLEFDREFDELLRLRYPFPQEGDPANVAANAIKWLREEYPPYIAMKAVLKHRQDEMNRRAAEARNWPEWLLEDDADITRVVDLDDRLGKAIHQAKIIGGPWGPACGVPYDFQDGNYDCLCLSMARHLIELMRGSKPASCEHNWTGDDFCPQCSDELLTDLEERDHQFGHD